MALYALAMLATTTAILTGVLGPSFSHSVMGMTISRHETAGPDAGSVAMSGLTVTGVLVIGVLLALARCRRDERDGNHHP